MIACQKSSGFTEQTWSMAHSAALYSLRENSKSEAHLHELQKKHFFENTVDMLDVNTARTRTKNSRGVACQQSRIKSMSKKIKGQQLSHRVCF